MSSQHRKRLRKNIAASISDASEQSDAEVEQINVFPNSPEDESAKKKTKVMHHQHLFQHIMWIQEKTMG